jgi:siroheme synthase-like protein
MYPILLDVTGRRIVIIGGGAVGLRKATKLIEAGARNVLVVSPSFAESFPPEVTRLTAEFQPEHLDGAMLVFAATNSAAVNAQVVAEARQRNALVNRADDEPGDFTPPAVLRDGPITVGVWTDHPALSAAIRDRLREKWDWRYSAMAEAMRTLRPVILGSGLPIEQRRKLFRALAAEAALSKLAEGGIDALQTWIEEKMRQESKSES